MKCPNCQRENTLRRAETDNSVLVACDVCGKRFKILRNDRANANKIEPVEKPVEKLVVSAEPTESDERKKETPPVLVPPPVIDDPLNADSTLEEFDDVELYFDDEENERTLVDAALERIKSSVAYFSQDVSPRYFQGIALYFLGTLLISNAFAFSCASDERFRIFVRFLGLTFSVVAFTALLTLLAQRFKIFDWPLCFTRRFLLLLAPLVVATLAVVPTYRATPESEKAPQTATSESEKAPQIATVKSEKAPQIATSESESVPQTATPKSEKAPQTATLESKKAPQTQTSKSESAPQATANDAKH